MNFPHYQYVSEGDQKQDNDIFAHNKIVLRQHDSWWRLETTEQGAAKIPDDIINHTPASATNRQTKHDDDDEKIFRHPLKRKTLSNP